MNRIFYLFFTLTLVVSSCAKDTADESGTECDPLYGPVGDYEMFIVRTDTFQTILPNSSVLYIDTAYTDNYDVYDCYTQFMGSSSFGYLIQNLPGYTPSQSARFDYDYTGAVQYPTLIDNYFDVEHAHVLTNSTPYGYELYLLLNATRDSIAITCSDTSSSCTFETIIAYKL